MAFGLGALVAASQGAQGSAAGEYDADVRFVDFGILQLRQWNVIRLILADQVDDGCWTTTRQTKTAAEIELIRSNIDVIENSGDGFLAPKLFVGAIGFETREGSCAVYVETQAFVWDVEKKEVENQTMSGIWERSLWSTGSLLSGPKDGMSERVQSAITSQVQEFLVFLENTFRDIISEVREEEGDAAARYWETFFNGPSRQN